MSSDSISPSNLPRLSASARLSASTSKARGSRPLAISFGRSTTSPTPTIAGMRCSGRGELGLVIGICFHFRNRGRSCFFRHCERSEAIHKVAKQEWIASSLALLAMTATVVSALLRHQRVQVLHRLDKIFLEFLHHGARGFHAVDQAHALSDEVADEVARLRIA